MKDNKLIAEFMGMTYGDPNDNSVMIQGNEVVPIESMEYHSSWDWLMPVVEEIESMGYEVIIAESRCKIKHNTDHSIDELLNVDIIGTKRAATYQAVLEFIKQLKERK
tara:strand:+ start:70 stop:393 length:324 start_codon:yes stop_codon:yes gene_type:complete